MLAKLIDLEPTFVGEYKQQPRESYRELPSVDGAQGVLFICPLCGNHSVICWFTNPRNAPTVTADAYPRPGRWAFTGETLDALSLSPSIDLSRSDGCKWHGCIKEGVAT